MNLRYVPGMRGIKTAVAVGLCLLTSYLMGRVSPFYSCIAAVVCMQPTHEQSIQLGIERTIGTLVGGLVGYIALVLCALLPLPLEWLFLMIIPIFLVVSVYLCNVLGREKSTAICCVVFLSISINHSSTVSDALFFAVDRIVDTIIGIVAAILVNRLIAPRFNTPPEEHPHDA